MYCHCLCLLCSVDMFFKERLYLIQNCFRYALDACFVVLVRDKSHLIERMRNVLQARITQTEHVSEGLLDLSYSEGRSFLRGFDAIVTSPLSPLEGISAAPRNLGSDNFPQHDEDTMSSTGSDFSHITIEREGPIWIGSVSQLRQRNLASIAKRIRALCYMINVIRQWRRFTRRRRCLRALFAFRLYPNGLTRELGVLEHVARYLF